MTYLLVLLPVFIVGIVFLAVANLHAGILFGASVPVEFPSSHAGRRILREYRARGVVMMAVFMLMDAIALQRGHADLAIFALPAQVLLWAALYSIAVRRTRPFAIQPPLVRTASLDRDHSLKPMVLGCVAALLPLLAATLYLHLHWASIPEIFPVHWGADGQANGWTQRTVTGVYMPIWIGVAVIGFVLVIGISVRYARGGEGLRRLTRTVLILVSALLSFTFTWVALLPLLHRNGPTAPFAAVGVSLVGAGIVFWAIVQQIRLRNSGEPYDGTPDNCWYAGMFYYNPADPSIFVPKRLGVGHTLNFAHPISWMGLAVLLLPIGFLLLHRHAR